MAERSILAYFKTPDQAEKALDQLKSLRLVDSRIERFSGYTGDGVDRITNPVTGQFSRLGNLTLGGNFSEPSAGILAAASVSASGYSSGGPDNRVHGHDVLLTAIVEDADYEKALSICSQEGAL